MIEVHTIANAPMQPVWQVAAQTWRPYCERHGYLLTCTTLLPEPDRHPSWNKLPMLLHVMDPSVEAIWCVDADMTVARPENPLPEIPSGKDVAFSTDWNGLCAAMFGVVPCEWSRRFLEAALFCGDVANPDEFGRGLGCKWEQNAFKYLLKGFPALRERVALLPAHLWNDRPETDKGETYCHFGGRKNSERIAMMKRRHGL